MIDLQAWEEWDEARGHEDPVEVACVSDCCVSPYTFSQLVVSMRLYRKRYGKILNDEVQYGMRKHGCITNSSQQFLKVSRTMRRKLEMVHGRMFCLLCVCDGWLNLVKQDFLSG